jgi:hypothetical protein
VYFSTIQDDTAIESVKINKPRRYQMSHLSYRTLSLSTFMSIVSPLCAAADGGPEISAQRPHAHLCPITQEVMRDPVVASDGFSYERTSILWWINTYHTSPMTRGELSSAVYPNQVLRTMISEWKAAAPRKRSELAEMSPDEIIGLQRRGPELSRQVQDQQGGLEGREMLSVAAPTPTIERPVASQAAIFIPDIARGHEDEYRQFLRGKLIYKPDPNSDIGRREFPIASLANPLAGTFDIAGCGDSTEHLQISTGFRTALNPANANKVEVWVVPQFVLRKDPRAHIFGDFLNCCKPHRDKSFAVLFNWGGWSELNWHEVTGISGSMLQVNAFQGSLSLMHYGAVASPRRLDLRIPAESAACYAQARRLASPAVLANWLVNLFTEKSE